MSPPLVCKDEEVKYSVIYVCTKCSAIINEAGNDLDKAKDLGIPHNIYAHDKLNQNIDCEGVLKYHSYKNLKRNDKIKKNEDIKEEDIKKNYNEKYKLENVIGNDIAKKELKKLLITRHKYKDEIAKLGNNFQLDKGIILIGPPGAGKSMLAKAMVNDDECKKYIELYKEIKLHDLMGSSQKEISESVSGIFYRMKKRYDEDPEHKVQLLIIDEIDGIFRKKNGNGSPMTYQLTNTLQTYIDGGYSDDDFFFIIGTSNHIFEIEEASMRSGRFKVVFCELPNQDEREKLIKMYFTFVPLDENIDLKDIAKITEGCSGADLAIMGSELFFWYKEQIELNGAENGHKLTSAELTGYINSFITNKEEKEKMISDVESRKPGRPRSTIGDKYTTKIQEFVYPSEEEMINFLIENAIPRLKDSWIEFKNTWEGKGCIGNQLEKHLKPSYKMAKERIDNRTDKINKMSDNSIIKDKDKEGAMTPIKDEINKLDCGCIMYPNGYVDLCDIHFDNMRQQIMYC